MSSKRFMGMVKKQPSVRRLRKFRKKNKVSRKPS